MPHSPSPPKPSKSSRVLQSGPTEYPPSFPTRLKELIALFLSLLESHESNTGVRLASEVFTPSARVIGSKGIYEGSDEIAAAHVNSKLKACKYHISRIYAFDASNQDLIMLGEVEGTDKTGRKVVIDIIYRLSVANPQETRQSLLKLSHGLTRKLSCAPFGRLHLLDRGVLSYEITSADDLSGGGCECFRESAVTLWTDREQSNGCSIDHCAI